MRKIHFLILLTGFAQWNSAYAAELILCSFNIQFLGALQARDDEGLAQLLKAERCDIIAVQELTAPPSERFLARNQLRTFPRYLPALYALLTNAERRALPPLEELRMWPLPEGCTDAAVPGCYPEDPRPIKPSQRSTDFFEAMDRAGFSDYVLSEENTGPVVHHNNSSGAEWFLAFFNPRKVKLAPDLPHGFIHKQRVGRPRDYDRTPFAFPFRTVNGRFDFTLISVHLSPGISAHPRRQDELKNISRWVADNSATEKDHFIIGDMNIEKRAELDRVTAFAPSGPGGWKSLNEACVPTNTMPRIESRKPYDHLIVDRAYTSEREVPSTLRYGTRIVPNFEVVDLKKKMAARWALTHPAGEPYPGLVPGYNHDLFRTNYSDHNPIKIRLRTPAQDDDAS